MLTGNPTVRTPEETTIGVFVGDYRLLVKRDSGVDHFLGE